LSRREEEFTLDDVRLGLDVEGVGEPREPRDSFGFVVDVVAVQFDAANDGPVALSTLSCAGRAVAAAASSRVQKIERGRTNPSDVASLRGRHNLGNT
jgi:hypothetical protein